MKTLLITGIEGKVKDCELMGTGKKIKCHQDKDGVTIDLDGIALDGIDTIIEIETK